MTDSLFNDTDNSGFDPNKNYLEELVGEGKKFATNEDLAKGKAESDNYIKTLTSRLDELRSDLAATKQDAAARANLEELIDRLSNSSNTSNSNNTNNASVETTPSFDPKQIEDLIASKIASKDLERKQEDNFKFVMGKLQEKYGANYGSALKAQSMDLGLDSAFVDQLAKNHPSVFIKTFGLDKQEATEQFQSPPRNSRRNDNFQPSGNQKRTWSWYQNLKKTDYSAYMDPKTTVQMHKDYEALGKDFEDGDFHLN